MFSHAVENPHLWSAEDPALYELEIELLDDAGHPAEVTGQKVGFRKFELKNNRMLLYEERMKLTSDVAEYKINTGKQIFDKEREESKLATLQMRKMARLRFQTL